MFRNQTTKFWTAIFVSSFFRECECEFVPPEGGVVLE